METYLMNELELKNYVEDRTIDVRSLTFQQYQSLQKEVFVKLETPMYPAILPIYKISNFGRIYDITRNTFVVQHVNSLNKGGYWTSTLRCKENSGLYADRMTMHTHRILMVIFCPVDGMNKLFVNHIDGDKRNCKLSNLEWTTPQENVIHAYQTGLAKGLRGEDSPYSTITENTAIEICELYLTGKYTKQEIADKLGLTKTLVADVIGGQSWGHISGKYDFSARETFRRPQNFTVEEIHEYCKYFQNHPIHDKQSVRSYIIDAIRNIKNISLAEVQSSMIDSVRGIYKKKYYGKITSQYTY